MVRLTDNSTIERMDERIRGGVFAIRISCHCRFEVDSKTVFFSTGRAGVER